VTYTSHPLHESSRLIHTPSRLAWLTVITEQKRRQAIREGFDRLTELVPGLEGQGRSEGLVLKRTVDYMRDQIAERQRLIAQIEAAGGQVDEQHKR
jgi:heteromeric Ino2p/Ino4p transcription factor